MPLPYLNRLENQLRDNGRMPVLHWERFRPTSAQTTTFAWWCCSVCLYATVMAVLLDALRITPTMLLLLMAADLVRWWMRFAAGKWYIPQLRLLGAPWTFVLLITFAVPMAAHAMHHAAWWGAVIGLATWRVIRVGQKIRTHYVDYALENSALNVETRAKWQVLRQAEWYSSGADPLPNGIVLTGGVKRFANAVQALRGQGVLEAAYAVFAAIVAAIAMKIVAVNGYTELRGNGAFVFVSLGIAGFGLWSALSAKPKGSTLADIWDATWHALHVFCESPPDVEPGLRAPWSERSRFGDADNRKAYLVWNMLAITLLVLAPTVFYPLISEPLRDQRLGEYPITGSVMGIRLLELRFDRVLSAQELWVYFFAVWTVPAYFVMTGLMAIVGPVAHGARELFENDNALEQS